MNLEFNLDEADILISTLSHSIRHFDAIALEHPDIAEDAGGIRNEMADLLQRIETIRENDVLARAME